MWNKHRRQWFMCPKILLIRLLFLSIYFNRSQASPPLENKDNELARLENKREIVAHRGIVSQDGPSRQFLRYPRHLGKKEIAARQKEMNKMNKMNKMKGGKSTKTPTEDLDQNGKGKVIDGSSPETPTEESDSSDEEYLDAMLEEEEVISSQDSDNIDLVPISSLVVTEEEEVSQLKEDEIGNESLNKKEVDNYVENSDEETPVLIQEDEQEGGTENELTSEEEVVEEEGDVDSGESNKLEPSVVTSEGEYEKGNETGDASNSEQGNNVEPSDVTLDEVGVISKDESRVNQEAPVLTEEDEQGDGVNDGDTSQEKENVNSEESNKSESNEKEETIDSKQGKDVEPSEVTVDGEGVNSKEESINNEESVEELSVVNSEDEVGEEIPAVTLENLNVSSNTENTNDDNDTVSQNESSAELIEEEENAHDEISNNAGTQDDIDSSNDIAFIYDEVSNDTSIQNKSVLSDDYGYEDIINPVDSEDLTGGNFTEKEEEVMHEREIKDETAVAKKIGGWAVLLCIASMMLTAYQMSENPDGVFASVCRLAITVTGCFFKILLYPCKKLCGNRLNGYEHHLVTTQEFREGAWS